MRKLDGEGGVRKSETIYAGRRNSSKNSSEKRLSCPSSPLLSRYLSVIISIIIITNVNEYEKANNRLLL